MSVTAMERRILKRPVSFGFLMIIALIAGLMALGLGIHFRQVDLTRIGNAEFCTQCGAGHYQSTRQLVLFGASVRFYSSDEIKGGNLTGLWEKYCGGCPHSWVFQSASHCGLMHSSIGCASPNYPARFLNLSNAIETLEPVSSRSVALRTMGHRDNLLRYVVADALEDFVKTKEQQGASFKAEAWWAANSNRFVVETNITAAEQFIKKQGLDESLSESEMVIDEAKRRAAQPK